MIAFAQMPIGTGGVLGCSKCAVGAERSPLPLQQVEASMRAIAEDWPAGPGPNIRFIDFEPFAHPELPAMISAARELGYQRISLRSDAGALAMAGNAPGVLSAGVRQLEVVLLGADADTHDGLAGRPGLFDAMTRGVAELWEAVEASGCDFFLSGYVPVCAHNVGGLPETVAVLASLGAQAVCLDPGARSLGSRGDAFVDAARETATVNSMAVFMRGSEARDFAPWVVADAI